MSCQNEPLSCSSFFQSLAASTARGTWTLWASGTTASTALSLMRVRTCSAAAASTTSTAARRKTRSFSQRSKSKCTSSFLGSWPFKTHFSLTVIIGIIVGASCAILILTMVSCFCCSCCLLYKKRNPSSCKCAKVTQELCTLSTGWPTISVTSCSIARHVQYVS